MILDLSKKIEHQMKLNNFIEKTHLSQIHNYNGEGNYSNYYQSNKFYYEYPQNVEYHSQLKELSFKDMNYASQLKSLSIQLQSFRNYI